MSSNYECSEYELTPDTLSIEPLKSHDYNAVRILEDDHEVIVHQRSFKIVEHTCEYFGASYEGRLNGTRNIAGIRHKSPIAIHPESGMYFFPTASPRSPKCIWIAHSHYSKSRGIGPKMTEITFKNNRTIQVPISKGSLKNQVERTAQFRFDLEDRIGKRNKYEGASRVAEHFGASDK